MDPARARSTARIGWGVLIALAPHFNYRPTRCAAAVGRVLTDVAAQPVIRRAALIGQRKPHLPGCSDPRGGRTVEDVAREIQRHLDFLPALLHDEPWLRKW